MSTPSTKVTVKRTEPSRRRKPAPKVTPKPTSSTMFEIRFGLTSFVLTKIKHVKEAK